MICDWADDKPCTEQAEYLLKRLDEGVEFHLCFMHILAYLAFSKLSEAKLESLSIRVDADARPI